MGPPLEPQEREGLAFAGVSGDSCLGWESERSHATLLFPSGLVFVLGNTKSCMLINFAALIPMLSLPLPVVSPLNMSSPTYKY